MTKICNCVFDSQIAYIVKELNQSPKNPITIEDFLKDDSIRTKVKKNLSYLVCSNGNQLITYQSNKRKSHFKHKNNFNACTNEMTRWHREWQECFDEEYREISIGNRRADVFIHKKVLEFQHSPISRENVKLRLDNYTSHGYELIWIIDCNDSINIETKNIYTKTNGNNSGSSDPGFYESYLITFNKSYYWKYENFLDNEFIYLHHKRSIYKINPNLIKSRMIETTEYMYERDFVESITSNTFDWTPIPPDLGTIYFNQRGAGCGKTYESIQLLIDEKFSSKEIFIYLTKMHSAKDVILKELEEQYSSNKLTKLVNMHGRYNEKMKDILDSYDGPNDMYEMARYIEKRMTLNKKIIDILKDHNGKKIDDIIQYFDLNNNKTLLRSNNKNSKQYVIDFRRVDTLSDVKVVIGSIDSFTYAVTNKGKIETSDYFLGLAKAIKQGNILKTNNGKVSNNGKIRYANTKNTKLNKKCLIIIDETQDLDKDYIEAFAEIIKTTGIDVYIIGDKLQSIMSEHNVYTFMDKNTLPVTVIRSEAINRVQRFHNIQFKNFVNQIVPFKQFNLPPIDSICNRDGCKHDDKAKPFHIFRMPKIYSNDFRITEISKIIDDIIMYMDREISEHQYLPKNFMFIFPILKGNILASQLESRLRTYWINKMKNTEYLKIVKKKDPDWQKNLGDTEYHEYAMLHKSEEGQPINLSESEHYTRLVSIHASKGNGCEVVFVLGLSEKSLTRFSKLKNNLVYESLLHVALTRQKRSIYIGIEENGDDIYNRFRKISEIEGNSITPQIDHLKIHRKIDECVTHIFDTDLFNKLNEDIIKPGEYINYVPSNNSNKNIIDQNHHIIRYYVFMYQMRVRLTQHQESNNDDMSQFKTILYKRAICKPHIYSYSDYYKLLYKISNRAKLPINDRYKPEISGIPILSIDDNEKSPYYEYCNKLKDLIGIINTKIINAQKEDSLPKLEPLECVVLEYMIQIIDHGSYCDVPIMKVYDVMFHYSNPYEYSKIIQDFHNSVRIVENIYDSYCSQISEIFGDDTFKYNINHNVHYSCDSSNFDIYNRFDILGYSSEYVIEFIIVPQFNKLNFYEVICGMIFYTHLLQNSRGTPFKTTGEVDNYDKFNGKKVWGCILTLDSNDPIMFPINLDSKNKLIRNLVGKYLESDYSSYHGLIYDFYNFLYRNKPQNQNSVEHTCKVLDEKIYDKIPSYIKDFFRKMRSMGKEEIINITQNPEIFKIELNVMLRQEIDRYLELNDNSEIKDY